MKNIARIASKFISLLVVLPCFFLAAVVSYDVYLSSSKMIDAQEAEFNVFLSSEVLNLVHELQKERGITAGFIGAKGQQFKNQLSEQRLKTEQKLEHLQDQSGSWSLADNMNRVLTRFEQLLLDRKKLRNRVDSLDVTLSEALTYYTNINNQGLMLVLEASKASNDHVISTQLFSLYNFSSAKESAGIERAVLNNVIAADQFTTSLRNRYITLLAKQDTYLHEAINTALGEMEVLFEDIKSLPEQQAVNRYRDIVNKKTDNFGLNASDWFSAATARIDSLKNYESRGLELVVEKAVTLRSSSVFILTIEIIVLVLGLMITAAVWIALNVRKKQSDEIASVISHIVEQRDLTQEIEKISHDELGSSADSISEIVRRFKKDLISFSADSDLIAIETQQTAAAIQQSEANLERQQASVQTIAAASEQMAANVAEIANAMAENTEAVVLVVNESQAGKSSVVEAVKVINKTADEMSQSAESIDQLNSRVGNISTMVDMIKGIAEQTNLLALNAAIEAARAGDQGRGFAVVADEVRNLAQRTQESTEEISNVVNELQTSAGDAYTVINEGRDNAILASEQAQNIQLALEQIVQQIEGVQEVTATVSVNTSEQQKAIEEVNQNIVHINNQASENVVAASQITASALTVSDTAQKMDAKIKNYVIQ